MLAAIIIVAMVVPGCGEADPTPTTYALTIGEFPEGAGVATFTGTSPFLKDAVIPVQATANAGYRFDRWEADFGFFDDRFSPNTNFNMPNRVAAITATFVVERVATGAWVDEVRFSEITVSAEAITQVGLGTQQAYAFSVTDGALHEIALADPNIELDYSYGSWNEYLLNPYLWFDEGLATERLNPFGVLAIREAMQYLIDRDYIADELFKGMSVPKYTPFGGAFTDGGVLYRDLVELIEDEYLHTSAKVAAAAAVIETEMLALGAYRDAGTDTWHYDHGALGGVKEVVITVLSRVEDERLLMGHYFADILEDPAEVADLGFKVVRLDRTSGEAAPLWQYPAPSKAGAWSVYTGGWLYTSVPRDDCSIFHVTFGEVRGWGPYRGAQSSAELKAAALALYDRTFTDMDGRRALVADVLPEAAANALVVYAVDNEGFTAWNKAVTMPVDRAAGLYGCRLWPFLSYFKDAEGDPLTGGVLNIAMPSFLTNPWNPVEGSNWVYDMFPIRATGESGTQPDPQTGTFYPQRIESATVTVPIGYPVQTPTTWDGKLSVEYQDNIPVDSDAWADWDGATQTWIDAATRFGGPMTALRKSVVVYPDDIYEVPLHDGSTLSLGDFVMGMIIMFDRGRPGGTIYDDDAAWYFSYTFPVLKGIKIVHDGLGAEPLTIATWWDTWNLDADWNVSTWFPYYDQGPGMWHNIALGVRAEQDLQLAFSNTKSADLGVEWTSFVAGPSLTILKGYLDTSKAANYIPYAPTMSAFITTAEATERWANLDAWYDEYGHFWVASGPLYLEGDYPAGTGANLKWFEDYREPSDTWLWMEP